MKSFSLYFLIFLLTITGCSKYTNRAKNHVDEQSFSPLPLPATFTGQIPCVDCDHIDLTLNLRPDGLYLLRKKNIQGEAWDSTAKMGPWVYDPVEHTIILEENNGFLNSLTLVDNQTLRILDVEGRETSSPVHYDLHRTDLLDPFTDSVHIRGMYRYISGIGTLTECHSGVNFMLSPEKDNFRIEHSYNTTPHGQGEALLISVEGRLVEQSEIEENPTDELLVVDRFLEILPDQDCNGYTRENQLFDITWKLVEVKGEPVTLAAGQNTPFIRLSKEGNAMNGFSGCNRFFGTYLAKGEIFVFNKMAGTRMACLKGLDVESSFLKAMRDTEAYRIEDGLLELRDRNEHVLARLTAEN